MTATRRHARRAGLLRLRRAAPSATGTVTMRHGNVTFTMNSVAGWTPSLVLKGEYLVVRLTPTPPPASDAPAAA